MSRAYYNEWDAYAAQWLRNLINAGHLPAGDVDERSIVDVAPSDLAGYTQCHFFAGIGGWALAARLAGWPDARELWTGSAPCQPFSIAGQGKAQDDDRHLWPHLFRLVSARRPTVLMGEQVAAAVGKDWLDGIAADLEGIGYACGAAVVPACAVDAPHRRDRLWFVADADNSRLQGHWGPKRFDGSEGWEGKDGHGAAHGVSGNVADTDGSGRGTRADDAPAGHWEASTAEGRRSAWDSASWITGHDGKARRTARPESGICLLAHGVSARVGRLRAYGNAIAPQVAAEVIAAYMDGG